jgi:hypothetical protein
MKDIVSVPLKKKPRKKNYINNPDFYAALCKYLEDVKAAKKNGTSEPRIPEYIGKCIHLLCTKMGTRPNFSGYSWVQEMISDGIENCIMSIRNFNPNKNANPFGYFSQISWNAFLRRIEKENKETYIKHKNMENSFVMNDLMGEFGVDTDSGDDKSHSVIKNFEDKRAAKKKKAAAKKGQ